MQNKCFLLLNVAFDFLSLDGIVFYASQFSADFILLNVVNVGYSVGREYWCRHHAWEWDSRNSEGKQQQNMGKESSLNPSSLC